MLCMSVLPVCVSVHHFYAWFPQRQEEIPQTQVIDIWEPHLVLRIVL